LICAQNLKMNAQNLMQIKVLSGPPRGELIAITQRDRSRRYAIYEGFSLECYRLALFYCFPHFLMSVHIISQALHTLKKSRMYVDVRWPANGEPLWLSGKMMEWENKWNQNIPGSLPTPGSFFFKKNLGQQSIDFILHMQYICICYSPFQYWYAYTLPW
jgi:hypothetical protein